MQPAYGNISAPAINITADIVINGESCTGKEGNSDRKAWKADPLAGWVGSIVFHETAGPECCQLSTYLF